MPTRSAGLVVSQRGPGLGRPVLRRPLGADPDEVAPAAGRRRRGREARCQTVGVQTAPVRRVGRPRLLGDRLGPAQVPGQRLGRVLVRRRPRRWAGGAARPARTARRNVRAAASGVERQRQRAARVETLQRPPAGLVVDDHELAAAVGTSRVVEPVDPAGQRRAPRCASPTVRSTPSGSSLRVEPLDVALDHRRGPAPRQRRDCSSSRKPSRSQPCSSSTPAAAAARRGRRPAASQPASAMCTLAPRLLCAHGGPFGRRRPVEVGEPVAARAVEPGGEPGRRRS